MLQRAAAAPAGRGRGLILALSGTIDALAIAALVLAVVSVLFLVVLVVRRLGLAREGRRRLALEEFSFRRHPRTREVFRLVAYSVVENLGYRQLNDLWRTLAFVDLARRTKTWGAQRRRGIGQTAGP